MGEITVLDHHIPLISQVSPGELTIVHKNGKREYYATGGGFAQITGEHISVLTDLAEHAAAINEKAVEEARKRAEEALARRNELTEEEIAATEAIVVRSLAQLRVKRKHYSHTPTVPTAL